MDLRVCIIRYVLLLSNKFKDALGLFYYLLSPKMKLIMKYKL